MTVVSFTGLTKQKRSHIRSLPLINQVSVRVAALCHGGIDRVSEIREALDTFEACNSDSSLRFARPPLLQGEGPVPSGLKAWRRPDGTSIRPRSVVCWDFRGQRLR